MNERLAVDVGNSRISIGLFQDSNIKQKWYQSLSELDITYKLVLDLNHSTPVFICSVVPSSGSRIVNLFEKNGFETFLIKLENQDVITNTYSTMGTDRLVNMAAAHKLYGEENTSCVVIDFGTATTLSAVDDKGRFIGGGITLGLKKTLQSLNQNLEQLPILETNRRFRTKDLTPLATSTDDSIFNATMLGHIAMVEKWLEICRERIDQNIKTVATGGLAKLIATHIAAVDVIDEELTLKGINIIGAQAMDRVDQG